MERQKLFNALDALFAYDIGSTDSGIKDDMLKKQVFLYLKSQCKAFQIYPDILTEYVKEAFLKPPYGLEDVREFIEWCHDNLCKV